jgi:16S rRNA (guanine966-N2)-methyltransferase
MHIIAGLYRQRRLLTPKGTETRPTASRLREALFNICQHQIEGAHFLDLFAGSGAMGLEALSRGAASVTLIDHSREAIRCIQHNVQHLGVEQQAEYHLANVFQALKMLEKQQRTFDIIFVDPPYQTYSTDHEESMLYSEKMIRLIDISPLLNAGGKLFIEEASDVQIDLPHLHSLKLKNERRLGTTLLQQYEKLTS